MKKEIKIAGAGLSGLCAGINLLKAGFKVVIFEKGSDSGLRFTNDFQGLANWMTDGDILEFLEKMNIRTDFYASPVKQGIFLGPGSKNKSDFKSGKILLYLVKRGTTDGCLDASLKRQFLEEGGRIEFNTVVDLMDVDIIATGPKKAKFRTLGYNFKTNLPDIVCEIMDNDVAPKTYSYLLIREGRGTLGTVLIDRFDKHEACLKKTIEIFEKEIGLAMENGEKFGGFADFFLAETAIRGGKLCVGEAAGFLDILTGFGMFFALRSGHLAAKSIAENINYDKLWKKEFNDPIRASMVSRFLFEIVGNRGSRIIPGFITKNQDNLLGMMKKGYASDWARKAAYPAANFFLRSRIKPA